MPEPASKKAKTDQTAATATNTTITWHDFHNDPEMGVIIRSEDGVYLRATSNALKRHSDLFKDMFALTPPTGMTDSEAFDLPYSATVIATYLDQITSRNLFQPPMLDYEHAAGYMSLVKYTRSEMLMSFAEKALLDARAKWSLDWLVEACHTDNVGDAKLALRRTFAHDSTERGADRLSAALAKVPRRRLKSVLRAIFDRTDLQPFYGGPWKNVDSIKW